MLVLALFLYLMVLSSSKIEIHKSKLIKSTSYTIILSILVVLNTFNFSSELKINLFNSMFFINTLNQTIIIFIFLISSILVLPWASEKININLNRISKYYKIINSLTPIIKEYSLIIIFTTIGSIILLNNNSLMSLFLTIELQSFGVYILASIYRESETATSAGLKYYLLGGLSSCMILLGSAIIYNSIGNINFSDIFISMSLNNNSNLKIIIYIGLTILISGLIFKVAAAPFHNWAPDVYAGVPTIITTWLAIMPKISILIVLLNITLNINYYNDSVKLEIFSYNLSFNYLIILILIFSFLSLIVGSLSGLYQTNMKRLLTFSTILNIGFMLIALATPNSNGLTYFLFYLIQYSLTSLIIFFILIALSYKIYLDSNNNIILQMSKKIGKNLDINFIYELIGLNKYYPLLILSLTFCMFSLAGVPPFVGFFAKIGVLISAMDSGYYFISLMAVIVSVISAFYYLRIVKLSQFDSSSKTNNVISTSLKNDNNENNENSSLTNTHSYILSLNIQILILFWIEPNIIFNTLNIISLNFYNL